jgi:adenylate kinase
MVDNISKVVKEYKEARGLEPIRVCILGAPSVGKTFITTLLCRHYKLHHIMIADIIKEAIEDYVSCFVQICGVLTWHIRSVQLLVRT